MRIKREDVAAPGYASHVQFSQRLTEVPLPAGLPSADEIAEEIQGYWDVLMGREDSPVSSPYLALNEVATAYYARALEIEALIHEAERHGQVVRGHPLYRVRTGALRSFIEAAKKIADLGSRRLTQEQLLYEQRDDAGEMY